MPLRMLEKNQLIIIHKHDEGHPYNPVTLNEINVIVEVKSLIRRSGYARKRIG